ncbi:MAG: hypothetical protein AABX10_04810 [Nanoarchaeota archaeon]
MIDIFKNGQISTEYLIVVGFVTFLVLGILGVAFFYTSVTNDQIKVSQVSNFANKIISSAESVFYAGEPSKLTLTGYIPIGITSLEILPTEIVVSITTSSGLTTMSFTSNVPLSGNISHVDGVKRIEVLAQQNEVLISEY